MLKEAGDTQAPRSELSDQEYVELEGEYRREEDRLKKEDMWNEHPRR